MASSVVIFCFFLVVFFCLCPFNSLSSIGLYAIPTPSTTYQREMNSIAEKQYYSLLTFKPPNIEQSHCCKYSLFPPPIHVQPAAKIAKSYPYNIIETSTQKGASRNIIDSSHRPMSHPRTIIIEFIRSCSTKPTLQRQTRFSKQTSDGTDIPPDGKRLFHPWIPNVTRMSTLTTRQPAPPQGSTRTSELLKPKTIHPTRLRKMQKDPTHSTALTQPINKKEYHPRSKKPKPINMKPQGKKFTNFPPPCNRTHTPALGQKSEYWRPRALNFPKHPYSHIRSPVPWEKNRG